MANNNYKNMTPVEAYRIALNYNSPISSFADFWKLEKIVYNGNDASAALSWAKFIRTQEDKMLDVILIHGGLMHLVEWVTYVAPEENRTLLIKHRIIELDAVKSFVYNIKGYYDASYSYDDFYEGLPIENKLGVMI